MHLNPTEAIYAFWHGQVCQGMTVTVCRFCGQSLAYSPHPEMLIIVEEHHGCPQMREFLQAQDCGDSAPLFRPQQPQ